MENYKLENVPLSFRYKGVEYKGMAVPLTDSCHDEVCFELDLTLNGEHLGTIWCGRNMQWKLRGTTDQGLVDKAGGEIALWYE